MMNEQDFAAVANVLAGELCINLHDPQASRVVRNITLSLADVFAKNSVLFDRERFYQAVGVTV